MNTVKYFMACDYYGKGQEIYGTFGYLSCINCVTTEAYEETMKKYNK